jgi:hypothetical protein
LILCSNGSHQNPSEIFGVPLLFYYMQIVLMDRFLCDVRLLAMDHVLECCYLPRLLRFVGIL